MKTSIAVGLGVLTGLVATPATAQTAPSAVRVMIAADDADTASVVRSSDMYHRIQLPVNDEMKRGGYIVIFEDAATAELGFVIDDRSSKQKSIELAKTACTSNKATLCPRVLILVKTRAAATDLGFGTSAQVRLTGEMIDISTNTYLGGWEAPTMKFPAPKACNNVCIEDIVGDNARKVALNLVDTLRKMLDQHVRGNRTEAPGAVTGRSGASAGLTNNYVINFEHFQMQEVLPLKSIIENEFPDTVGISLPDGGSNSFSFNYATKLKADKVLELLHLMMEDRGYSLSRIKISTAGDKFIIDRIVDDGYRPKGVIKRFQ